MTLDEISQLAAAEYLAIFGAFHPGDDDKGPVGAGTVVLLGPREPGYWAHIQSSPEWRGGAIDPIDSWSTRVITALADQLRGEAHFPFGGPPYAPFFTWALASGAAWRSPVSLLVHATAGLMVSYRGAIALPDVLDLPAPATRPCDSCDKPCLTACTARALTPNGYDLDTCHAYLDTPEGAANLTSGCAVRRSCPVSQSYGRVAAHSAYHMSVFHK